MYIVLHALCIGLLTKEIVYSQYNLVIHYRITTIAIDCLSNSGFIFVIYLRY